MPHHIVIVPQTDVISPTLVRPCPVARAGQDIFDAITHISHDDTVIPAEVTGPVQSWSLYVLGGPTGDFDRYFL